MKSSNTDTIVPKPIQIIPMLPQDWNDVRRIYLEGISTGNATFSKEAPTWEEWNNSHLKECRFVARLGDRVVGWVALSPTSNRCVYAGVAEISIYVEMNSTGHGLGSLLLQKLIETSEQQSIWTIQSGIFPENVASLKLHKKFGFREVGRRERLGKMDGVWRDVLLLERRSNKVGIE
ncbi:GNAT family N-acetyltransferase [Bacillus sp. T3]|uniref:GNAT family N-acetyltransferase n=1 Tax=Bacillus sp. T3 TaxID=467262 RepID=UPI00298165B1|nr:GNAT family N-acetyltransferase [Bacillus sp. T3]